MTKVDPRTRAVLLRENGVTSGTEQAKAFGGWLRSVREGREQTRVVAAKKIGVADSVLSGWERGVGVPGEASLAKVRRWLGPDLAASMEEVVRGIGAGTPVPEPEVAPETLTPAQVREAVGLPPRNDIGPDGVSVSVELGVPRSRPMRKAKRTDPVGADEALLEALIGSSLPARSKALLSAAVVALLAGVDVEVEVRAKV